MLVAATVATLSFVVPYFNDELCTAKARYEDSHAPVELLPAAQFYCEDDQLNDYALL